jgi:hypothetical protein
MAHSAEGNASRTGSRRIGIASAAPGIPRLIISFPPCIGGIIIETG